MISTWGTSTGYNQFLTFLLPLGDLGAGAVDTTPVGSAGSATPTFTRATVAWTKLSTGLWAQVASGTARSCYLGATTAVGAYGGYFAEGAGTQLVTPTASIRDMTDGAWTAGATMTVAQDGAGIDGVANSCSRLTGGAVSATNTIFQTLVAAASSRTYSVWLKRVTGAGVINITQTGGTSYTDVTADINSSTFTRVSLTESDLNAAFGIQVVTSGDVILADFNQFEAGAFATSPIAAAGAARNADSLSYASAGNISTTIGSVYAEWTSGVNTVAAAAPIISDSVQASYPLYVNNADKSGIYDGTNVVVYGVATTLPATSVQKSANSWSGTTLSAVSAGGTVATGSFDGTMNMTALGIGTSGNLYGTIRNVRIYSSALTAAQLQAMTS